MIRGVLLLALAVALASAHSAFAQEPAAPDADADVDSGADAPPRPELVVEVSDGPLTVTLRAAPREPVMGEAVSLRLWARVDGGKPADVSLVWPDLVESLTNALGEDVVEVGVVRRAPDGLSITTELRLYDAGEFALPELRVRLPDRAGGTRANLSVTGAVLVVPSVLAEESEPVPGRDALAYEPELAAPWLLWAAAATALLLIVAALLLLRRRRAEPEQPPSPPPVPPHERALTALRALAEQHLPERGEVDPYFTRLSEILRGYLEDRFGLRAPEQTTEEFLAGMSGTDAGRRAITAAHREILSNFLTHADLVKFARAEPDVGSCEQAGRTAERFVQETAPRAAVRAPGHQAAAEPATGATS